MLYSSLKRGKKRGCELLHWFKMNVGFFFSHGVVIVLWREQIRLGSLFFFFLNIIDRKCPQEHPCFYGYRIVFSFGL